MLVFKKKNGKSGEFNKSRRMQCDLFKVATYYLLVSKNETVEIPLQKMQPNNTSKEYTCKNNNGKVILLYLRKNETFHMSTQITCAVE